MRDLILSRLDRGVDAAAAPAPGRRGDHDMNPEAPRHRRLTPAAVLVPLVERPEGMTVLLTRRTDHLDDHPGQVSFPGGRVEAHDAGPVETALRETEEEIGLERRYIEVVGALDHYETVTGFLITPVVGLVTPGFSLTLDDFEVAEAFEVPLDFVLDPVNHERQSRVVRGIERHYYVLPYEDHFIWGATAGMLVDLHRKLFG